MKRGIVFFLLCLSLLLAGCGGSATSTPPAAGASAPAPTSSTSVVNPTTLHVTRTDLSSTHNLGPLDKTITDATAVRQLYKAALALPTLPSGQELSPNCANASGVVYHLDFLQSETDVQHMNLDPGSCMLLYFSQTDLHQMSSAFLRLFGQVIAVSPLGGS